MNENYTEIEENYGVSGYIENYHSATGRTVWVHNTHTGSEKADNEWIARFLADNGESVKLLSISSEPNVKNSDAEIDGLI